jgi:hypothetical protein
MPAVRFWLKSPQKIAFSGSKLPKKRCFGAKTGTF